MCGSDQARVYVRANGVEIVRCSRCTLLYRPAVPEALERLYTEDYFRDYFRKPGAAETVSTGYADQRARLLQAFGEHIADLERFHKPGRLLDVGCAMGFLLEAARRRGWQVVGLDLAAAAVEYARREFQLDVRLGPVERAAFPEASFDVITAFELIEHVVDPAGTLGCFHRWLRPDGLLVLTTPNAGSYAARRHPERFEGFLEPPHLVYFTPSTMRQLLRRAHFRPLEVRTDLALMTSQTLSAWGVPEVERWRALVNRLAPGLKAWARRTLGRAWGGGAMKVYAAPIAARA